MDFNDLPPETQDRIRMIGFRSEIEEEDERRRLCTTFGYNRGGLPIMVLWMMLTLFASGVAIVGLAIYAPSHNTYMSTSSLPWLTIVPPLILIPLIPFLFLKLRYAVRATAIVLAIFLMVILAVGVGDKILGAVI